jgi:hypothetical protein
MRSERVQFNICPFLSLALKRRARKEAGQTSYEGRCIALDSSELDANAVRRLSFLCSESRNY